ncbi:hypothetical protein TELCIR_18256 [Teladorsagia circumcincta]|uniref:Uncharacterized protein n=1 Tax=Teladorsagia circumcincta TaxID=45464 RepID=A0A2G9TQG4_TELCI|nr:hypothetical protein TELCIR_18256 [Teladorsagia circumcincta]
MSLHCIALYEQVSMSDSTLRRHVEEVRRKNEPSTKNLKHKHSSEDFQLRSPRLPLPEFKPTDNEGPELSQAELESLMAVYDRPLDDYLEMFIQVTSLLEMFRDSKRDLRREVFFSLYGSHFLCSLCAALKTLHRSLALSMYSAVVPIGLVNKDWDGGKKKVLLIGT